MRTRLLDSWLERINNDARGRKEFEKNPIAMHGMYFLEPKTETNRLKAIAIFYILCIISTIRMEEIVDVICDVCGSGIKYPLCFQLNPCQHRACAQCFHQFVPAGVFHRCPCQGCNEWVTSSTLLELENMSASSCPRAPIRNKSETKGDIGTKQPYTHKSSNFFLRQVQEVPHFQPDEQMDPFRHWAIQKPDLYTGLIYVAYRSSEEQATFYKSCFKVYDSTVFMDDDSTDEMVKIFARILHPLLFQQQKRTDKNSASSVAPTNKGEESSSPPPPRLLDPLRNKSHLRDPKLSDHYQRQDRQGLAMRCMYALSSGRVLTRAEQEETFGGTRKNLKHSDDTQPTPVLASTQQLARELLKAYQASHMARNHKEEPAPKETVLPTPPTPVVHDLRLHRDEDSEGPSRDASSTFDEGLHWIPPDESDNEGTKHTTLNHSESDSHRVWEKELGLNQVYGNQNEIEINNDTLSPVVPAILWILSAVFLLSK